MSRPPSRPPVKGAHPRAADSKSGVSTPSSAPIAAKRSGPDPVEAFRRVGPSVLTDIPAYFKRKSSLRAELAIAILLVERAPADAPALERERRAALAAAAETVEEALEVTRPKRSSIFRARLALLRARKVITTLLDAHARADDPVEAKRIKRLQRVLFGPKLAIARTTPREACVRVQATRGLIERHPARQRAVTAVVPAVLFERLFAAHDALRAALDEKDNVERIRIPRRPALRAMLSRHIDHYALAVLATASPGDTTSIARALRLLEPITYHRVTDKKRRARKKRDKARKARNPAAVAAGSPAKPQ